MCVCNRLTYDINTIQSFMSSEHKINRKWGDFVQVIEFSNILYSELLECTGVFQFGIYVVFKCVVWEYAFLLVLVFIYLFIKYFFVTNIQSPPTPKSAPEDEKSRRPSPHLEHLNFLKTSLITRNSDSVPKNTIALVILKNKVNKTVMELWCRPVTELAGLQCTGNCHQLSRYE